MYWSFLGSSKQQESSEKIIYFCFIDYAEAFDCGHHNKLWKILEEMGHPPLPTSQFISIIIQLMLAIINSTHFHFQKYASLNNRSYDPPNFRIHRSLGSRQKLHCPMSPKELRTVNAAETRELMSPLLFLRHLMVFHLC